MFEATFHPLHEMDLEALKKACMGPTLVEKALLNKEQDVSPMCETPLGAIEFGSEHHFVPPDI